ncbi:dynamin family protein [Streptomyces sp. NPDC029526]|uniref:dynamin family protein n=1 Tax=Streptomyces sp. NPDC029526 TaxID=3155728 RepID=UPI00340DBC61
MNQHHDDDTDTHGQDGPRSGAGTPEQEMNAIAEELLTLADAQGIPRSVTAPLRSLAGRWQEPFARVAVLGEVSTGKSTLINSLLEHDLLPSAVQSLSSVPVEMSYGPELTGTATVFDTIRDAFVERDLDGEQEIIDYLTTSGERTVTDRHGRGAQVLRAFLQVPAKLLAGGLRLVDTPGVGGANPAHRRLALAALSDADAVLFVARSGEPLSATEQDFLARAAQRVDRCLVVQTQSDLAWDADRRLRDDLARLRAPSTWAGVTEDEAAAERLARLMSGVEGLSVSARLALDAQRAPAGPQRDEDLELSGLPELTEWLRIRVAEEVDRIHRRAMVDLTESTTAAVRRRTEETRQVMRGDEEAQRAIEERERRIADWERTDGDSWREHLNAALASLALDLPQQAKEDVAALRAHYRDQFDGMKRAERKEAAKTLPQQPQAVLDEMLRTVQERLREAVRGIAERDDKGLVAGHLERLGGSAKVSVRIPGRPRMSDAAWEQMLNAFIVARAAIGRSRRQRQDEEPAGAPDSATSPSHDLARSTGATGPHPSDARSTAMAVFTSLALGTVKELFARRSAEREQLVTLFDRVAKAITEEAVAVALKEAKAGCEAVTTVIDDLLAEQRDVIERDQQDLRLALEVSPEERAERIAATRLCLRRLDELAGRTAAVGREWDL